MDAPDSCRPSVSGIYPTIEPNTSLIGYNDNGYYTRDLLIDRRDCYTFRLLDQATVKITTQIYTEHHDTNLRRNSFGDLIGLALSQYSIDEKSPSNTEFVSSEYNLRPPITRTLDAGFYVLTVSAFTKASYNLTINTILSPTRPSSLSSGGLTDSESVTARFPSTYITFPIFFLMAIVIKRKNV
jgi:hypothetical protein